MQRPRCYLHLLFLITIPCTAQEDIDTLLINCAALENLWQQQYGPTSPLNAYLETYRSGICLYATRRRAQENKRAQTHTRDALITTQLEANLADVKEHVAALLAQHPDPQAPPLDALAPPPATNVTVQSQDMALQQALLALQNLQEQQSILQASGEESMVKQQLLLFGIGILFLAGTTYAIARHQSPHLRALHSATEQWITDIYAPHDKQQNAGLLARLRCAFARDRHRERA